jgi:tetratricopeptide (TPR) repeat protein
VKLNGKLFAFENDDKREGVVKKILIALLIVVGFNILLTAQVQKVAVLQFNKNDKKSEYVSKMLMSKDFKGIFKEYEEFDMIPQKEIDKIVKDSGYTDLSVLGKERIAELGKQTGADILLWGSVSAVSESDFKVQSYVMSMRSIDIVPVNFEVKKASKSRRASIEKNLITKMQEFSSGEVQKIFDIGLQYLTNKSYPDAETSFLRVLEMEPENSEAFYYLGFINFNKEDYDKAEEFYLKGLEIEPENVKMLDFLSTTYLKAEDIEKAGETRKKIIEIEETKEQWFKIGFVYLEDEEYFEEAVEALHKAIELDANYGEAYVTLGVHLYDQESYDDATEYLEQASKLYPEDENIQKKLAKCYKETGKIGDAIEQYKSIIAEQPDNMKAYMNLANAYSATEQFQLALDTSIKLSEIIPDNPKVYILTANSYSSLKRYTEAETDAKKAISMDAELYQPYRILSEIYQAKGYIKYEKFLKLETDAKEAYGADADALVAKRDTAKKAANSLFTQAQNSLNAAKAKTENSSELKYIASRKETLKQLLEATKKDFF